MDIFNRVTPVYKTAASVGQTTTHVQPAATSCGLSSLLGSLFGNATPIYKSVDGARVNALAPSGLLGSLFGSATPSYKTVPAATATYEPVEDAPIDLADADSGDASSMPCIPISDEVVLL